ncbi:MAG TPA: TerC family protein [Cyclobacteriaceae bacterium]|jgi:predicted tellurium resistance membrane protein TerC
MEIFLSAETWLALVTLTFFEVVLGIDNIIFISIVSNRLPENVRARTRNMGLILAMVVRILLLLGISWVASFHQPLFSVFGTDISGRDLVLAFGGLFLIAKSTREIHQEMEGDLHEGPAVAKKVNMNSVIAQIILLDIIFSFDSILTAVGLTSHIPIMVIAIVLSIIIMIAFSGRISDFIHKHPSLEVLALGFLILIGFMLFLEGLHYEIPKGYIYFAVAFSLMVEMINMRIRKAKKKKKQAASNASGEE